MNLTNLLQNNPDLQIISGDETAVSTPIPSRRRSQPERDLQTAVFQWRDMQLGVYPELAFLYASLNGQYAAGHRTEPGLTSGVPDLHLPLPRRGYHGLWIELKAGKNKPSASQTRRLDWLNANGHYAVCIWDDLQQVIDLIVWYLAE